MAHSLINTEITGGIVELGRAKAVGCFKTLDHHDAHVVMSLRDIPLEILRTWTGSRSWRANLDRLPLGDFLESCPTKVIC